MKSTKSRLVAAIVSVVIIVLVAVCYGSYFSWVNRGDTVLFDPSGKFGWGSTPMYSGNGKGGRSAIGTIHNFLFVQDEYVDPALLKAAHKSAGGAAPAPGPPHGPGASAGRG